MIPKSVILTGSKKPEAFSDGHAIPSSVAQVAVVIRYELLNYFRSRRFFVLLAIELIIASALTGVNAYYGINAFGSNPLGFYTSWFGSGVLGSPAAYIVLFSAIFFGGDAISGEFQNKTGYFVTANPVQRSALYVGKWVAALAASLLIFGMFSAIALGNAAYYFGIAAFPYELGESLLFSVVYVVAILGITFFFSSLFKNSSMSILVSAVLFVFGFPLIQEIVSSIIRIEPWFILTYGSGIISSILTVPYPAHVFASGRDAFTGISVVQYNPTVFEGLGIMLVYFAITFALGLAIFERKEFN